MSWRGKQSSSMRAMERGLGLGWVEALVWVWLIVEAWGEVTE